MRDGIGAAFRGLCGGLTCVLVAGACTPSGERAALECIAPAAAGGGWDLTCRATARILRERELIPRVMRVTNLPGAGGGIAFSNVVARRSGDPNVIVAASPATTLRLAQGQYGDLVAAQVRWVAALGADFGAVAVRAAASWHSLHDLMTAWRTDPSRIVVGGGSAVGGQDHIKMLILARAAGIDPRRIRYVPFDGGGEAMTALLGGFIQVFSGDASEVLGQHEAGNVRVVGMLAPERVDGPLADVHTAREQGYAVDWITWRGFYVPGNVADDVYARWTDALRTVEGTPEWREIRRRYGLGRFLMAGAEFEAFVNEQVRSFEQLSHELGLAR